MAWTIFNFNDLASPRGRPTQPVCKLYRHCGERWVFVSSLPVPDPCSKMRPGANVELSSADVAASATGRHACRNRWCGSPRFTDRACTLPGRVPCGIG